LNTFEKGVPTVDLKVWMYLSYLVISIGLTIWVARTLSRNGLVFLEEVFAEERLAKAVNHLLVVGFYLVNLGYISVALRSRDPLPDTATAMETLSFKIGFVLLVLGALHFFNIFALNRYRRTRLRQQSVQPPLPPNVRLQPQAGSGGFVPPGGMPPPARA
jgi:hypothetical protein